MWASQYECDERFVAMTCPRKPAEPGDTRFEYGMCEEGMEETPYWVESIDDTGTVYRLDFFATRGEIFDMIGSFRYCQAVPFEVEFAPFGPAWQREQEGRVGGRV